MKLLTREAFETRNAELIHMRDAAEAEYRRVNLAVEMGSGTEADILKAKEKKELIEGRIQGLHSARAESERLHAAQIKEAREAAHKTLVHDVNDLLGGREEAIARIEARALEIGSDMRRYDALTDQLRAAGSTYRPHFITTGEAGARAKPAIAGYFDSLSRVRELWPLVAATASDNQTVLDGHPLSEREVAESRRVRDRAAQIAPRGIFS